LPVASNARRFGRQGVEHGDPRALLLQHPSVQHEGARDLMSPQLGAVFFIAVFMRTHLACSSTHYKNSEGF
jgi:hypothetical protein